MVTFNGGAYLRQQMESVIQQLGQDDELVIVDNCSTDDTIEIIADFCEKRNTIRTFSLGRNLGVVRGFELCALLAEGNYIFFSDQDDVWLPDRLEKQLSSLQNADLSICNAILVNSDLQSLGSTAFEHRFPRLGWSNLYKNAFIGCTMAITREGMDRLLPFPSGIPMHDWYIAQAAFKFGFKLVVIPEALLLYRRHGGTASSTGKKSNRPLIQMIRDRLRLFFMMI